MNQHTEERRHITAKDLEGLSYTELIALEGEVKMSVASIEYQIDMSKAQKEETGKGYHRDWYARANFALRAKKATLQVIQRYIGDVRKKEHQDKGQTFERMFMEIAHRHLPEQVYKELLALTYDERDREDNYATTPTT